VKAWFDVDGYGSNPHVHPMSWPPSLNEAQKQALKQGQIAVALISRCPV
jgi:hypothetical protein